MAAATTPRRAASRARLWPIRPGLLYLVGIVPAVWALWLGVTDRLGADPVKALEHVLGLWALRFLLASLAVTPLRRLLGLDLLRYRRALGLLAFAYATLHLLTYAALDQGLAMAAIWADIVKRWYITVGMLAYLALLPLALTSNRFSIRRLGAAWGRLHRLAYLAAAAAPLHFALSVKSWPPEPLVYAGIAALLLGYRLVAALRRRRLAGRRPAGRRPAFAPGMAPSRERA